MAKETGGVPADLPDRQADRIDPLAMTVAQAAKVLSAVSGEWITEEMIRSDVEAGVPVTADGRINLVFYAAWLVQHAQRTPGGEAKRSEA